MPGLQAAYVIAIRRIFFNWRLELVLLLGIVLAVSLMSSGVVFSDLLAEAALRRSLDQSTPQEANVTIRVYNDLDDPVTVPRERSTYQAGIDFVDRKVAARFDPFLQDRSQLLETATFFFEGHPQLELADTLRPRGKVMHMTGLLPDRIEMVDGHWPYSTTNGTASADQPLEVAVDVLGAQLLQLAVGDEMGIYPAAGSLDPSTTRVRIVGVFQRLDTRDEFWYGADKVFSYQNEDWTMIPLFTQEDVIVDQLAETYLGLYTNVSWFLYLDRHSIQAKDVNNVQDTVRGVRYDLRANLEHSTTNMDLDRILDDYEQQLLLARIPFYLMIFLVTGILIYYLALVTSLIVKSRSTEIATFKSRGSTTLQIGLLALVEGVLLAIPAIALGPLLALGVSRALGNIFIDTGAGGTLAPVSLSSEAFLLGAGGALLAVAVLTISTLVAARWGIVEFRQAGARPPKAPFVHRYYLDILVLLLIGLAWWQIQSRGSFLVRELGTGNLEIDFSLLLGPVLGLLALGLLVLRFLPVALSILSRLVEPIAPAWLGQGLRRVSRDPIAPGTLVVMLMLATALGVIGSAFSSTLERSQEDRALYAAGADLRVQHLGDRTPIPLLGLSGLTDEVTGIEKAVEVERADGSLLTKGFSSSEISVLAVNSAKISQVAWYRPDFSSESSLESLTTLLVPDPSASYLSDGITFPQDATSVGLWVNPGRPERFAFLTARFQDARGYYFDVFLGQLNFKGWRRFAVPISPIPAIRRGFRTTPVTPRVDPPFTLLSIRMNNRTGTTEPGAIFMEDLVAITPAREVMIDDFQTLDSWHAVEDFSRPGLYAFEASTSMARNNGGTAAAFSWSPGGVSGVRGINAGSPVSPMPALVNQKFLDIADAHIGDTLTVGMSAVTLPIRPVAVADYFPTLYPREEPFAVVDLKTYNHFRNMHDQRAVGGSNELWVSLNGSNGASSARDISNALESRGIRVRDVQQAAAMVADRVEQPLVNAGWGGLLVLMFLALVLASASGVMLFSYMDMRERQTEFALLRTIGFSKWQLNGVVWFNLFVVVVCGIGIGTWAGQQIGVALLPILEVAEEGVRVTPPMVLQTNWVILLVSYLVLAAVTLATVLWLAWLTAKLEVQQVLRIGEA